VHETRGRRDPALAFPLPSTRDNADERRQANRATAVSAIGLAVTGLAELLLAIVTGSVGLLGDAIHNLSDVSTSAVVFLGFRLSRRPPTEKYPYGLERAEDLARAPWTGRTLRVEVEGWVDPEMTARDAGALGHRVADEVSRQLPEAGSFIWTTRAAPV
jgi:divalent metal cation (Fe/Co/Zn/Cd) transporter